MRTKRKPCTEPLFIMVQWSNSHSRSMVSLSRLNYSGDLFTPKMWESWQSLSKQPIVSTLCKIKSHVAKSWTNTATFRSCNAIESSSFNSSERVSAIFSIGCFTALLLARTLLSQNVLFGDFFDESYRLSLLCICTHTTKASHQLRFLTSLPPNIFYVHASSRAVIAYLRRKDSKSEKVSGFGVTAS